MIKFKLTDVNRALAIFLLVQIVILVLFLWGYNAEASLSLDDCKHESITVEEKYTVNRKAHSDGMLHITYNGGTYVFSDSKCSTRELFDAISVGESIDVYYVEEYDLFSGTFLWVVDARTDNDVYVDVELYNKNAQTSKLLTIISFAVLEVVFLAILGFDIFLYSNDIKKALKKLKNGIKKKDINAH